MTMSNFKVFVAISGVLAILKLLGVIDWTWVAILAPVWWPIIFMAGVVALLASLHMISELWRAIGGKE